MSAGNAWFTLIGFMGMYAVLAILFLFLVYREIEHGPAATTPRWQMQNDRHRSGFAWWR